MTPEYAQTVAAWLAKAHSDLAAARLLIQGTEPHFDSGVYHCQQAAEKALKGWLTSRQVEFRKTHDLTELLSQCIDIHHSFSVLEESARFLVPFASQFRYPGDLFEPPVEEATRALADASSIEKKGSVRHLDIFKENAFHHEGHEGHEEVAIRLIAHRGTEGDDAKLKAES